jgi:hypothetical protein
VLLRLSELGQGLWQADGKSARIRRFAPPLEIWRTKLTRVRCCCWVVWVLQPELQARHVSSLHEWQP